MTVPFLTVKPKSIKLKVSPRFPAQVIGRTGIDVTKANGNYYFDLDYAEFPVLAAPTAGNYIAQFDPISGHFSVVPSSSIPFGMTGITVNQNPNFVGGTSQYYSSYYAPQMMEFVAGTAASPVTTVGPLVKLSRTESMSSSLTVPPNNPVDNESNATLAVYSVGTATDGMQTCAILAAAQGSQSHDNVAGYFSGRSLGSSTGIGTGAFFEGLCSNGVGGFIGAEIHASNTSGVNRTYNPNGFSSGSVWASVSGGKNAGAAYSLGTFADGALFDVGYGATASSIVTATFRDDSSSITSLLVNGSHTNGIDLSGGTFSSNAIKATGFSVSASGTVATSQLIVASASNASATLNSNAGSQAFVLFQDGGTNKWQVLKQTDNSFNIFDVINNKTAFSVTTSGVVSVGESGQNTNLIGTPTAPTPTPGDNSTKIATTAFVQNAVGVAAVVLQGYLCGLTLSTAGASTTFSVAAGVATDSTVAVYSKLAASINKTTAAWAVGSGNGALDTGAIAASTWYHVWLIERTDLTVTDVLVSLSATTPTMPTNYTFKRRIGSLLTNGASQWTQFVQVGDEFIWTVTVGDVNTATLSTTSTLFALTVPTGVQVNALFRASVASGTAGTSILVTSPDASTEAAGGVTGNVTQTAINTTTSNRVTMNVRTNTSAQIRAVASLAATTFTVATFGWWDRRGRDT